MKKLILAAPTMLIATLAVSSAAQAQEPANPVGFTVSCNIAAGQTTCNAQKDLPAGKRIVLEHVSARVTAPSGQTIQVYISTSSPNLPSGTTALRHFLVLTPNSSGTYYFASQPIRMYGTIGSYVLIHGQRNIYPGGAPGAIQYDLYFSGYLLP